MDAMMENAVDPLAIDASTNGTAAFESTAVDAVAAVAADAVPTEMPLAEFVAEAASDLKSIEPAAVEPVEVIEAIDAVPAVDEVMQSQKIAEELEKLHEDVPVEGPVVQPEFVESVVSLHEEGDANVQTEAVEELEENVLNIAENQEEIIHAEMAEIHDESQGSEDLQLHLDGSIGLASAEADAETEMDTESYNESEMILEETTGEYVLASSLKTKSEEFEEDDSKGKLQVEDPQSVAKLIEENLKSGEMQPGEQIVVVTSDEKGNAKEVLLTLTKTVTENGVTVQHVVDESGEVYLIETVDSAEEVEEEEEAEPPLLVRPKRHQKKLHIPNHVLGRNIVNPVEDTYRNGKAPPKPRLGVKIPYRNLTSQIVSKQEIAEEILERSRRFSRENRRQNMFARKLTQTLAKKLQPKDAKSPIGVAALKRARGRPCKVRKDADKLDNSDLLAILEGDDAGGDSASEGEPRDTKDTKEIKEMTTEMEREIALKQLSELPEDPPPPPKDDAKDGGERGKSERKGSTSGGKSLPFTGNPPLKTYGRKRITSEDVLHYTNPKQSASKQESPSAPKVPSSKSSPNPRAASPDPLAPVSPRASRSSVVVVAAPIASPAATATASDGLSYVTKSSRVIKRKVIWDPDEVSPKKGSKIELSSPPAKVENKDVKKDARKDVRVVSKESKKVESPKRTSERIGKIKEDDVHPKEEPMSDSDQDTPEKEKPTTPVKVKRRLNEVTKLLMDEGAVNMLYSIKNEDAPTTRRVQKSQQTKADEILNELSALHAGNADRSSPKALRKKDAPAANLPAPKTPKKIMCPPTPSPISRQKSKDSNRSSVHSPPPSPSQSFGGVESRIIRRHSSSSYSSMGEEEDGDERRVKKLDGRGRRRAIHPAVENSKKKMKIDEQVAKPLKGKSDNFEKLVEVKLVPSETYNKYKHFTVSSANKLIQIELHSSEDNDLTVYLTHELMHELMSLFTDLEADVDVNVVMVKSSGLIFCNGLNFKTLVFPREIARKAAAKKLAKCVNDFLLCLAKFPKVLVAAVHGDCFGIGVTMLPLFDMIIANEDATFTIPNAKLGCIAEGGSLLLLPHLSRNVLVNELLYSSQTLSAEDAVKLGLVTRVLTKQRFTRELLSSIKCVSDKSAQFMVATKKQLRKRMIPDITASLNDETENLIEQWTSEECQKNFAEFFDAE